jgi:hypothetical protein
MGAAGSTGAAATGSTRGALKWVTAAARGALSAARARPAGGNNRVVYKPASNPPAITHATMAAREGRYPCSREVSSPTMAPHALRGAIGRGSCVVGRCVIANGAIGRCAFVSGVVAWGAIGWGMIGAATARMTPAAFCKAPRKSFADWNRIAGAFATAFRTMSSSAAGTFGFRKLGGDGTDSRAPASPRTLPPPQTVSRPSASRAALPPWHTGPCAHPAPQPL